MTHSHYSIKYSLPVFFVICSFWTHFRLNNQRLHFFFVKTHTHWMLRCMLLCSVVILIKNSIDHFQHIHELLEFLLVIINIYECIQLISWLLLLVENGMHFRWSSISLFRFFLVVFCFHLAKSPYNNNSQNVCIKMCAIWCHKCVRFARDCKSFGAIQLKVFALDFIHGHRMYQDSGALPINWHS